jgi:RimJ/RimL family protein N-acetyltransferase
MDILPVSPDDATGRAGALAVYERARKADSPDSIGHTPVGFEGNMRYGWDGVPPRYFAGYEGGRMVGMLAVYLPRYDNTHAAWFDVTVAPEHRRRGIGTELLALGTDIARQEGRRTLGIDGWDQPATHGFAAKHGYELKAADINRRQVIADLDWDQLDKLYDEAQLAAEGYQLLRIVDAVPDDLLDAVVTMTAAINDAPTDDLDVEDEVFSPERVRAFEHAMITGRNRTLYRVVARHNESGELGGHSLIGVERDRPEVGWQLDTAVVRAHRGHRLGLLVKIELLRWLRDTEPRLVTVDTWNAESNKHMIAVNEAMGYRIVGRGVSFQRS